MLDTSTTVHLLLCSIALLATLGCNNLADLSANEPIPPPECLDDEMVCDGLDDDCDGDIDEGLTNPCGGCLALPDHGDGCGECGTMACDGAEALLCEDPGFNTCGTCGDEGGCNGCVRDTDCGDGEQCSDGVCVPEGFVLIAAGSFTQGSPGGEPGRDTSYEDAREVLITRPFLVQATEVTEAQWRSVMGNAPSYLDCGGPCPVEKMDWTSALVYANGLSERKGLEPCYEVAPSCPSANCDVTFAGLECEGYRLLTEAEWEYAARAGSTTATYAGDIDIAVDAGCSYDVTGNLDGIAWYCRTSEQKKDVAGLTPNDWGLYDMSGNVTEWVWDAFNAQYSAGTTDPVGALSFSCDRNNPDRECDRVVRGGSYNEGAKWCRSAARRPTKLDEERATLGFRVARTIQ